MQAEAEQGFVFFGVHGEFLQFFEDVAVEEAVVGPLDVQGIFGAESAVGQQGQDLFQPERPAYDSSGRCRLLSGQLPAPDPTPHLMTGA